MARLIPGSSLRYLALFMLLAAAVAGLQGLRTTNASRSVQQVRPQTLPLTDKVTVHAAKRGNPWINLADGREPQTVYQGEARAQLSPDSGAVRSLALASADFDGDGFADLVVGYSVSGSGAIALHRVNPEAIAPKLPETSQAIAQLNYPSPFLPEVNVFPTLVEPDFIGVGDFNGDGFQDVVVAARGQNSLCLLPGDGHGNFKEPELIALPGNVTALLADNIGLWKGATDLMVGIDGAGGSQLLVYSDVKGAWRANPVAYALPSTVTALTSGVLDKRTTPDIVVAALNQLIIVHPSDGLSVAAPIERIDLSFSPQAVQVGHFIWDRESRREIAALSADGQIHVITPGTLDRRPFSQAEVDEIKRHQARHDDAEGQTRLRAFMKTLVSRPDKYATRVQSGANWIDATSIPASAGASQLIAAPMSNAITDDLIVVNNSGKQVQVVVGVQGQTMRDIATGAAQPQSIDDHPAPTLDTDSVPVAVLPMKLNLGTRNGLVVLSQGKSEPTALIAPAAVTIQVDRTDDSVAAGAIVCDNILGNNNCTLRGATIMSNATAGPNQINVPAGTYTLTLPANNGAPNAPFTNTTYDDEWLFCNGWFPNGGDLDLGSNDVTINGAGAGTTIIQAGTTATTTITNASPPANTDVTRDGNGIDRVFEVNDCGSPNGNPIGVTISNVTIRNGYAPEIPLSGGNFWETGGAVQFDGIDWISNNASNKTLTLTNVTLTNNFAASEGGAVCVFNGALSVTGSTISNNISFHSKGGGIAYAAATGGIAGETLLISNTSITGNKTEFNPEPPGNAVNAAVGGGVWTSQGVGITINNSSHIDGNTADLRGGGLVIENSPVVQITGGSINNNTSKGDAGGLASDARTAANAKSTIALDGVTITGNTSQTTNGNGNGGGIYNHFGDMTITSSSATTHIDNNTAGLNGGGIFSTWTGNNADLSAGLSMTNGTLGQTGSGNKAKNNGGGIAVSPGAAASFGTVTLVTVTIQANQSNSDAVGGGDGGGIFIDSGSINPLNGDTLDTNVATAGTGSGIFMNGGSITGSGTISLNGGNTLNINGGTFTSTPGTFNLTGDFTRASGGTFTHNSGTFNFNGGAAQSINGTATTEAFNNFTVNKGGGTLTVGGSTTSLSMAGAVLLSAGGFNSGTATQITDSGGDWTNNGGTFTPNAGIVSFTNTGAGQNINGTASTQTFNSITMAKTAQTLAVGGSTTTLTLNGTMLLTSGTFNAGTAAAINVAGDWTNNGGGFTPGAGTVTFNGGGTQNLNGSAATQTFNNFTVSKGGGTLTGGGSTTTLTLNGNMSITGGTFAAGTITTINDPGNWGNTATFTAGSSTVNLTGNNNTQTLSGNTTFNNLTCNHTGTGNATASGSTLAVTGLMRVQSGTFISSSTYNNVQIDSGTTFQSDGSTINVSGNWTNNGGTFTPTGDTVNFNGNGAQSIGGTSATQTFNAFTVNKGGGTLSVAASTTTLTLTGTVTLTAGTFAAGTATTINVAGDWTNNGGTFTPGAGTTNFNGGAGQNIGGTTATTFNNLTNSDAAGIAMNNDNTANGVLALTSSDITVASGKTLTQPSTAGPSTGTFDVIGSVRRTGANLPNSALTYGNPDNVITLAGSALTSLTVNLTKAGPTPAITGIPNSGWPAAVLRTYLIAEVPAGNFTPAATTVQLHYLSAELNGNSEATPGPPASLRLYRYVVNNPGTGWQQQDVGGANTTLSANHFVKVVGIKGFSPWTIANSSPTAESASIGGTIIDANGAPVSGATINLSGTDSRETITDANGNYNFDGVGANGFYTVTPARVNYTFSPANRSFSLVGVHTDASFTATGNGDHLNAIDTTEFFVRQQYLDFLGREPDPPGFAGWVNTINNCASGDTSCDRVHVSEMFFRSEEFQQRGYYVYRFYSTAFGQKPDYAAFTPDMARVSGFLDATQLEAAKTQFASDFTMRPAFVSQYGTLSNAQYVDALAQTAGVTLSNRQTLVDGLEQGTMTRAQALRQIAESNNVYAKYYNQAFVVMEYFGYLRRDPDALYLNWISVLDANPADSRHMVEGFVDAAEYRNRFKQ
jgi:hypothetical protein